MVKYAAYAEQGETLKHCNDMGILTYLIGEF